MQNAGGSDTTQWFLQINKQVDIGHPLFLPMLLLVAYWSSCFHNNHNFGKCFLPSALGLWLLFKMESQNNLITGTNYTDDLFLNEGVCVFVCSIPSDSACVNFFFFIRATDM